jgi:superfamily II DNA or RNA helicase
MSTPADLDVYRLNGYLGILAKRLRVDVQLDMQERLTLQMKSWNDAPDVEVEAFYKKDGYFWIPRFYFENAARKGKLGKHDVKLEWTHGEPQNLPFNAVLDPKRGQPVAVDRMVDHIRDRSGGILVAPTGCISGDTHVHFSVKTLDGKRVSHRGGPLERLYRRFNGLKPKKGETSWRTDVEFFVPSVTDEDEFYLNKVEAVIDSGEKIVFKVTTASGNTLKATADHEFMTEKGFFPLNQLGVGDRVGIYPGRPQPQGGRRPAPYRKEVFVKSHPTAKTKVVNGCTYRRLRVYQAVFEAHQNGMAYEDYIFLLNRPMEDLPLDLWTIPPGYDVHHLDDDHENNAIENLVLVEHASHARDHGGRGPKRFVELDEIVAIEPVGVEHVYDIKCADPYRNFVAGGVVVHNCGKTILGYAIGQRLNTTIGVLVYNSHMVKNWVETAKWLFGLGDDEIGIVQRDRCDLGRPVTVMMVQSLLSETQYPEELYNQFGIIIADEVNRFGAPQWNEVMKILPARYRVGMSADPTRDDGLDNLVQWHFGNIAHKVVMQTAKPEVVQVLYDKEYPLYTYTDPWRETPSGDPMPNPLKYDKVLAADQQRNAFLVGELVKMRRKGRRILIFSRFRNHLTELKKMFESRMNILDCIVAATEQESEEDVQFFELDTKVTLLVGGLEKNKRDKGKLDEAMKGDVIFCTYAFGREALNVPHIDTELFATPPGKPLQPIGRLRDKGPPDRRPLLAVDPYENVDYSIRKAQRRCDKFIQLGIKVSKITRTPK